MATVIRLKRGGRSHDAYYRVVVMDSRDRARGREIDSIGVYQPTARPKPVMEINLKKALAWLEQGAQTTDTVKNLLSKSGVLAAFASGKRAADVAAEETAAVETQPVVEAGKAEASAES